MTTAGHSNNNEISQPFTLNIAPKYKRRFLVLTPKALHWVIRKEGKDDLFGDLVGSVKIKDIIYVRGLRTYEGDGPVEDELDLFDSVITAGII